MNQRWKEKRTSYRPLGEVIDTSQYEVVEMEGDAAAKAFVCAHHYSGSYPAARWRFGMYRASRLVGVAVFSHPVNDRVLTRPFPGIPIEHLVDLGRFVLLDSVPGNGESWFIARCFELLRRDLVEGVTSAADPVARTTADGTIVMPGHVGTIYQAHNGVYLGRGTARTLRVLPDGTVFSDRAIQKLRKKEKGWQHCLSTLVRNGADVTEINGRCRGAASPPAYKNDPAQWTQWWTSRITTPLRHSGNHKYAWGLGRVARKLLDGSPTLAYPKRTVMRVDEVYQNAELGNRNLSATGF